MSMIRCEVGAAVTRLHTGVDVLDALREALTVPDFDARPLPQEIDLYTGLPAPQPFQGSIFLEEDRIPTGLLPWLRVWAMEHGHQLADDFLPDLQTTMPEDASSLIPGITLRPHQIDALGAVLRSGRGVIEMATGGGKSEVSIAAILALSPSKTLILAPTVLAADQFCSRLALRGIADIGRIGNGLWQTEPAVVVAVAAGLARGLRERPGAVRPFLKSVDFLIIDEVHHEGTAPTWREIVMECGAWRRVGLSATPWKSPETAHDPKRIHLHDSWIVGLIGPTIYYGGASALISQKLLTDCRVTVFRGGGKRVASMDWATVYRQGVTWNEERNDRICTLALNLVLLERTPLISVEILSHGRRLQTRLIESGVPTACSYGGGKVYLPRTLAEDLGLKSKNAKIEQIAPITHKMRTVNDRAVVEVTSEFDLKDALDSGTIRAVVGSKVYDESIDYPVLTDLIVASAGRAKQRYRQKIGRILRRTEGKTMATIWDPFDGCHFYLSAQSKARLKTAVEAGFVVDRDASVNEALCSVQIDPLWRRICNRADYQSR